jgi:hypothetical protein
MNKDKESAGSPAGKGAHVVTAGKPIMYETADHAKRSDSPTYVKSRKALSEIAKTQQGWFFGEGPYQDHHGGGLWVYDEQGWFFVRNLVGLEWSGQFCADPKKVDQLRLNAKRLYAAFPRSAAKFKELDIDLEKLLTTAITDAAGVSEWTDSICNASVPLPQPAHTGFVPKGGGVHNYPTPVTDIDYFRYEDFQLWVTDEEGQPAAVVPVAPRGSGKSEVRVVHSTPGTKLNAEHVAAERNGEFLDMPGDHSLAKQAFRWQTGKKYRPDGTPVDGAPAGKGHPAK